MPFTSHLVQLLTQYCAMPTCTHVFVHSHANCNEVCCYMQAWANTATNNNGRIHLTFLSLHVECCWNVECCPSSRFQLLR